MSLPFNRIGGGLVVVVVIPILFGCAERSSQTKSSTSENSPPTVVHRASPAPNAAPNDDVAAERFRDSLGPPAETGRPIIADHHRPPESAYVRPDRARDAGIASRPSAVPVPPGVDGVFESLSRDALSVRGPDPLFERERSAHSGSREREEDAVAASELLSKELRFVTVFYGTNRRREPNCLAVDETAREGEMDCLPGRYYSGEPVELEPTGNAENELEVGKLVVTLPPDHATGNIERPLSIFSFTFRDENPGRDVLISNLESYDHDFDRWARTIRDTGRDQAFVYVHGFANTFTDAALRAAQVAYDLDFDLVDGFRGLVMTYSWPSRGRTASYLTDYDASADASSAFNLFLDVIRQRAGIQKIHVIAHSMGNRLVTEALRSRGIGDAGILDQLILAAPDIAAAEFKARILRRLPSLAKRITLYVSENDRALAWSGSGRDGVPRAGQVAGGLLEFSEGVEGFDAIDASNLPTDFLGHSYYADNDSMLSDIYCVLLGHSPRQRPLITRAGPAWRFLLEGERRIVSDTEYCRSPIESASRWKSVRPLAIVATVVFAWLVVVAVSRRRHSIAD